MNKKITFVLVLALAAFLVMGSASAGLFDFLGGGDTTVKIGYLPSDHDSALFVADAQGLYADKGINTELVQFNNGGDLMTAMASGDVDVGYVGISPVLSSAAAGVPIKVISSAQIEGSGILVTDDSGIKDASDLAGKTVATPGEASIQHVLLSYYLEQNGLSLDDINESAMKVPSINDALKTNNIPSAITFQPYVSIAESGDGIEELVDSSEISRGPAAPLTNFILGAVYSENQPTGEIIQYSSSFYPTSTTLDHGGSWLAVITIEVGYAGQRYAYFNNTLMTWVQIMLI